MLTQPTTDKILLAIADDLNSVVLPSVTDEPAKVLLGQIDQLLRRLSRRTGSEINWMIKEIKKINAAIGRDNTEFSSYLLTDIAAAYSEASGALGDAIDQAFKEGDSEQIDTLREVLVDRIAIEQEILGQLDLVGRG
ncbi:MAG: hypothetical protein CBC90_06475 [Acidimicrobiaceae bacterium TMED130]|mgnify:FL=1|nr:MAG: hypothetical protein CBC90_06475 [Acidimicrobiaceae bacterium TMED130]|tara:strand:+ start:14336 stop:14746 length:411 start_codon:yes stop_codon:yes gene_type:complete